ncbi:hypothetical protein DDD_2322 [Nonlabens dokdonensis DSW-6]|uniref:Uncharacterized protein n=1 Tax=Nonlabens dokdonensis (strain DSM 17205 / KCTC 12402 / DSW-6) TaxID=592029 RepID=L7WBG9_NONDD|nr:hypothetical protein DDD_2322 [Nonlabens dokdonensis DSW-6]
MKITLSRKRDKYNLFTPTYARYGKSVAIKVCVSKCHRKLLV